MKDEEERREIRERNTKKSKNAKGRVEGPDACYLI